MKKFLFTIVSVLLVVTITNAQSRIYKENYRYNKDSVKISWSALYTTDGKVIECLNVSCKGKGQPIIYTPLDDQTKSITLPRAKAWKVYNVASSGNITGFTVYNIDYEAADQKKCTPQKNSNGDIYYIDSLTKKRRPDIEKCKKFNISEAVVY